jgi:hypothetical protein
VEGGEAVRPFGAIGPQDEVEKRRFLLLKLLLALFLAQIRVHTDIMLALVLTEVEDFKRAVILTLGLQSALHTNHALAGRVDGKLS